MNKAIYWCAAAALALASCSNDETVEIAKSDAINFRPAVGLNTRATELTTAELENINKLYVTTFKTSGELLYTETEYTKGVDGWYAGQYWGKETELTFYLTSPKLSEWKSDAALSQDNKSITGFTIADAAADQKDFVVANKTATKAAVIDVELEHVLSQIVLQAKSSNTNYKYKVKGVRFHNAQNTGDIDLSTAAWSNTSGAKNYEVTYETPVVLNENAQSIMGTVANVMLLPQNVAKWNGTDKSTDTTTPVAGSYISVLVNITTSAGVAVYPAGSTADNETYGWTAVPVDFNWTKGNKYIYTFDFTKGAGKVDPVNPGPDVDPGNKDPEKPDPILGDEIKFNVTVKDWNDVDVTTPMN